MNLIGTKALIFDSAIELFSQEDFDKINMRLIAQSAGIKAASIYNHFKSKQDILNEIYDYYEKHFDDNIKNEKEIFKLIESGTKEEIMKAIAFTFESEDQTRYRRMVLITKIIYVRLIKDPKANDIFLNLMSLKPVAMLKRVLDYGIEIGRFSSFDTEIFAKIMNGYRHFMGLKAFLSPNYTVGQLEEEERAIKMLSDLLPIR